ncbi:hypothetical protein GMMP1_580029 [Candidatus Magnetomoraceae bacterium gMMP-1]
MQSLLSRINHIQQSFFYFLSPKYSKLFLIRDNLKWSLSWDIKELKTIAKKLNI